MNLSPEQLLERTVSGTELIIIGDSPEASQDYDKAIALAPLAHVMFINNAGRRVPTVPQLVATLHSGKKDFIDTTRMPLKLMHDALLIGHYNSGWEHERVDVIMHGYPTNGTSALFGVLAAVYLGYSRIIVAGCPLTHYMYGTCTTLNTWKAWSPWLCQRVESVSGNTKRILDAAKEGVCISIEHLLNTYSIGHGEPSV